METDIKKLEALLADKKFDEAKAVINSIISAKMTESEKGDALVGMSSVYLDIMNSINAKYESALNDAIAGMRAINKAESKMNDKIRLAEVKESLGK
jgi:hypothetical protein